MLRWALYIAGALALIVLVVFVIGYLLPVAHVASRHATFTAPPERVFAVLTEVNEFPAWRPDVHAVEVLSAEPLRWRERGGNGDITFEVQERIVPARLVTRIADPTLPFGGTWTFELVPEGSGTRLTITERGEVYNPVFRFVSRFIIGHAGSIEQYLAALEGRLSR
jgi:hypothetical protein